jgi:hypothetical protein
VIQEQSFCLSLSRVRIKFLSSRHAIVKLEVGTSAGGFAAGVAVVSLDGDKIMVMVAIIIDQIGLN